MYKFVHHRKNVFLIILVPGKINAALYNTVFKLNFPAIYSLKRKEDDAKSEFTAL